MNFSVFAQNSAMMDVNLEVIAESEPTPGWLEFKDNLNTTDTTIFEDYKNNFGLGSKDEMLLLNSVTDKYGFTHNYYRQTYHEIPVENGQFRIQSNHQDNTVWKGNGRIVKGIALNPIPTVKSSKATALAIEYMDAEVYSWEVDDNYSYPSAELIIIQTGESNVLAYKVDVYTSIPFGGETVYVNAQNGNIEKTVSLYTAFCGGENDPYPNCNLNTNVCSHFGTACIKTNLDVNEYKLVDECRGIGIVGYNSSITNIFTDEDNNWECEDELVRNGLSTYYVAEKSFDFFVDMGMLESHIGATSFSDYIRVFANRGSTLSDQISIYISANHSSYIDAISHEFVHAIEWNKNNRILNTTSESLGIEESFCDILGTYVEASLLEELNGTYSIDYYIQGAGRNMSQYKYYSTDENGNYNGNSTTEHLMARYQNHWFYLLSEGGEGDRPNKEDGSPNGSYSICAINSELIKEMVFHSFFRLLSGEINMYDAREASLSTLRTFFVLGNEFFSTEEEYLNIVHQVTNAWYAVGVGSPYNNEDNPTIIEKLDVCSVEALSVLGEYDGYVWSTGETTNSIAITEQGTYNVTLTHFDNNGNAYCGYVGASNDVFFTPFVDLGADENGEGYHCRGTALDAGFGNGNYTYQWSTGETTQAIVPEQTGIYTVTVTDLETNCVNINTVNMTNLWFLETELVGQNTSFVEEGVFRACSFPVTLQISGDYDLSNDFLLHNVDDPLASVYLGPSSVSSFQIESAGAYRVTRRNNSTSSEQVIGGNGVCSSRSFITIIEGGIMEEGEIPSTLNICSGDNFGINIKEYFIGAQEYIIFPPNEATPIIVTEEEFQDYSVTVGGEYTIKATESICNTSAEVTFDVNLTNLAVTIDIEDDSEPYCGGVNLTINNENGAIIETYEWSSANSNVSSDTPFFRVENETTNSIVDTYMVTVTSSNCTATASVALTIHPLPKKPTIEQEDINPGCGKTLSGEADSYIHTGAYTWFLDGEEYASGVGDDEIAVKTPGTYSLEWKNITNSSTGEGCIVKSTSVTFTNEDLIDEADFSTVETQTNNFNDLLADDNTTQLVWNVTNGPDNILGTLIVPDGVELLIANRTISFLDEYSGILVEKGGRLRLEGATLQAHECGGTNWLGIKVDGTNNAPHLDTYSNPSLGIPHPNHGIVIMTMGSTIRDAAIGIHVHGVKLGTKTIFPIGTTPDVNLKGGGFIHIEGANSNHNKFINNKIGILMERHDDVQRSLITYTDFINEGEFLNSSINDVSENYVHIYLNQASRSIDGEDAGLHIYKNYFTTNTTSGLEGADRGTGIVTNGTKVVIGQRPDGDFEANVFSYLFRGVDASNSLAMDRVSDIIGNIFINVERSITLNTSHFSEVNLNKIFIPFKPNETPTYGIFARQSHSLIVRENELMMNTNVTGPNETKGLILQDCFASLAVQNENADDASLQTLIKNNIYRGDFAAAS